VGCLLPFRERATPLTEKAAETCPVCGAQQIRTVYSDALDPITQDFFPVVECSACHLVYTGCVPACLDRYYPPRYRGYGPAVTRILGALYNLRVSRWARLKPLGGSVLEIGCGAGLMLAAFKRRGWRVLGIERNEAAAEIGRNSRRIEIVTSPVAELSPAAQFDLIVMFQVLEHIADPVGLLRECTKRLAPGGHLVANVPNFSSWQSTWSGARWFHLDVPRHLNHFTPATLEAVLERAGLRITRLSFVSLEHDPYGWVESALNRMSGRRNVLTRFLMGLDRIGPGVLLSFVVAAALSPAALMVSLASWLAGRGALMEVTAMPARPQIDATRPGS
jgi:2-polyprenyl-3-methyl-5-hydroxy-6-metoxy-1,4-benzoquinol methylase